MDKFGLVKRNTDEILGEEDLKKLLKSSKNPVVYWGTAPTGAPHLGYFFPMLKVADLLKVGFKVKILLADLHAALDNTPWEILEKRYEYYSKVIPKIINAIGVDTKNLEFVKGSSYQMEKEYIYDLFRLSSFVSVHDCNKAASEVVKMGENPKLSGLIYPLMQVLDEEYLKVDCQLGGTDQRKIFVLARENLSKLGYKKRIEIINPLVPSLSGGKMSSSEPNSKIDLFDDEVIVKKKINSADCVSGDAKSSILAFVKYIIMVIKQDNKEKFIIERPEKFGGNLEYLTYESVEKDFVEKKLHPLDLKNAVAREINSLLKSFRKDQKLKDLYKKVYG